MLRHLLLPYWQPHLAGQEHLPTHGPVIVVCNHPTMLDGFLVSPLVPRVLNFMIKDELLKIPLLGPWIRATGVLPVGPGIPTRELSLERLREGRWVGILAEGSQTHSYQLAELRSGAAVLAKLSGVPVVPAGIVGSEPLLRADAPYMSGGPVRVSFGPPLVCGDDEEASHFLARIRQALIAQIDLDQPLPPLRRDLRFHLCQLFWAPTTWLIFTLLDWFRPGAKR